MKITKNGYLQGFGVTVLILALVRCIFPSVSRSQLSDADDKIQQSVNISDSVGADTAASLPPSGDNNAAAAAVVQPVAQEGPGHPVVGVLSYKEAFPDSNYVHMEYAEKFGIQPITGREALEREKNRLVYIGGCPFFTIDPLRQSVPYLVPRASLLLYDIGRNFMDSLQVKHLPLHKIIVTSVLRSRDDLQSLSQRNVNASENSCHLYGTTFDISYNRYKVVADPDGPLVAETRNDTLKYVLCEVLRDLRQAERCAVKYEVKQGCFHITTR